MKPIQFTIRRLLIAVAVFGVFAWAAIYLHRQWVLVPSLRAQARFHAQHANADIIAIRERSHTADPAELSAVNRKWKAYHNAMRQKYEGAAAFPWFGVTPDPPNPVPLSDPMIGRWVDLHYN